MPCQPYHIVGIGLAATVVLLVVSYNFAVHFGATAEPAPPPPQHAQQHVSRRGPSAKNSLATAAAAKTSFFKHTTVSKRRTVVGGKPSAAAEAQAQRTAAADGPSPFNATCRTTPRDVCEQCQRQRGAPAATLTAAGRHRSASASSKHDVCQPAFKWSWDKPLGSNDAGNGVGGLRAVRGVAALDEPGIEVVAQQRMSNWPALVREGAVSVRAVSEAERLRLCSLWRAEHSYQGWSVMLGCAGRAAAEYEPRCRNRAAVYRVPCGFVDLAQGDVVKDGGVYDGTRWFRDDQSRWPPNICASRRTIEMRAVAVAMSVYPEAVGHFVPEHLPKALLLHKLLPAGVPILIADSPVSQRYLAPLFRSGALPRERVHLLNLGKAQASTIRAESVYGLVSSHFSNVASGDGTFAAARDAYAHGAAPAAPRHVLLVDRGRKPRHVRNDDAAVAAIERALRDANRTELKVLRWRPAAQLEDDILAWRQAALVVAPHGAGLANLLFAREGCPVIEICYDETRGMLCPAMYAALGVNLHLPYWVITAKGGYASGMQVDTRTLEAAAVQALAVAPRSDAALPSIVAPCES